MLTLESFDARIEGLKGSAAFRNYREVRRRVFAMTAKRDRLAGYAAPSAYWREELSNFEYMLDASPLIIEKLRHHTHHITGLKVYEYRSHKDEPRARFAEKLRALVKVGGEDLLVPEARELGGFGHEIDGALYNLDTLKFFECLTALRTGAVLSEFQRSDRRRLAVEIGAGWGGFPYQFKTVAPNTTYVIVDFPELFLFSATYLMTLFPGAKCRFWGDDSGRGLFEDWQEADFIFVPDTALEDVTVRPDLVINMVSFQEMRADQVDRYVRFSSESGAPYLYSLNRDRSPYNRELSSVRDIIGRYYWPREISVLPVSYTKMLDGKKPLRIPLLRGDLDYHHVVGWRRLPS